MEFGWSEIITIAALVLSGFSSVYAWIGKRCINEISEAKSDLVNIGLTLVELKSSLDGMEEFKIILRALQAKYEDSLRESVRRDEINRIWKEIDLIRGKLA